MSRSWEIPREEVSLQDLRRIILSGWRALSWFRRGDSLPRHSLKRLTTIILILVGIIHLLPLSGVFGAERLSTLYGIGFQDPNILILMRHRAVLFGIFGVFLIGYLKAP